jgi:hypothetical protein
MAKTPVKKAPSAEAEFTTDAPRQGPIGERQPLTEAELIAADAAAPKKPPKETEDA